MHPNWLLLLPPALGLLAATITFASLRRRQSRDRAAGRPPRVRPSARKLPALVFVVVAALTAIALVNPRFMLIAAVPFGVAFSLMFTRSAK